MGVVELLDDLDVALEQRGQARGELARVRGHGTVIDGGRRVMACLCGSGCESSDA